MDSSEEGIDTIEQVDLPRIYVFGDNNTGKKTLAKGITKTSLDSNFEDVTKFLISTKYYTAETEVHLINMSKITDDDLKSLVAPEAIIFLYANQNNRSFYTLQKKTELIFEDWDPEIRLLVENELEDNMYVSKPPQKMIEDFSEKWNFEVVKTDVRKFFRKKNPYSRRIGQDAEGILRVIEALECHMWPNMERVKVTKKAQETKRQEETKKTESYRQALDASKKEEETKTVEKLDDKAEIKGQVSNKDQESESKSEKTEETAEGTVKIDSESQDTKEVIAEKNPFLAEGIDFTQMTSGDQDEIDQIGDMMKQIKAARELSSTSSDMERRDRAADIIMQLAGIMGDDDEEL